MVETAGVIKESHGEVERLIVQRVGMVGMVRKMGIILRSNYCSTSNGGFKKTLKLDGF